jgi:hypothetical protein
MDEENARWARLHRLLDPEDLIRDPQINGDQLKRKQSQNETQKATQPPKVNQDPGNPSWRTEEEFRRRVDESDVEREWGKR